MAFISASQDVVIDAYRTDLLPPAERGLGASLNVLGYRLAMILSGGVALIWTDATQGSGWTWPQVYQLMAGLMAGAAVLSALLLPRLAPLAPVPGAPAPAPGSARNDLLGFAAVVAAVVAGYLATLHAFTPLARALLGPWLAGGTLSAALQGRWIDLLALLLGIGFTLPLAAWAARRARFETLLNGLGSYFAQPGAAAFLAFIVLYKLGDAFAGALMTPFLLKTMAFSSAEVGVVNKIIGLWLTLGGALLGGLLMLRLGLWRALLLFGVLQAASNLGFWWLATQGKGSLPGLVIPAFDLGFVSLAQPTQVGRRAADGHRGREPVGRHGHGGLPGLPDEPDAAALHRHPVRHAQRVRVGGPGVGGAAGRRAGRVDRLAHVLHRLHRGGAAGAGHAVVDAGGGAPAGGGAWRAGR